MSDQVEILISRADGGLVTIAQWGVEPHDGCEAWQHYGPYGPEETTKDIDKKHIEVDKSLGSSIVITPKKIGGPNPNELAADAYRAVGYGYLASEGMPAQFKVNKTNGDNDPQIAHMSVDGEVHLPCRMKFFFPVSLTTPDGLRMNLVLGQSNAPGGLWATLKNLYDTGKHAAKACGAAESDQEYDAMKQAVSYDISLKNLLTSKTKWHLTAKGTGKYPCAVVDYNPPENNHGPNPYKGSTSLLCMGETKNGFVQAARFYVLPDTAYQSYRFGLKVYPPKPKV